MIGPTVPWYVFWRGNSDKIRLDADSGGEQDTPNRLRAQKMQTETAK